MSKRFVIQVIVGLAIVVITAFFLVVSISQKGSNGGAIVEAVISSILFGIGILIVIDAVILYSPKDRRKQ